MTRHCGGTFTDMGGLILSPNYPLYYPNMHDCLYMIKLPDKDASGTNLTIKITCDDFRTQGLKVNINIYYLPCTLGFNLSKTLYFITQDEPCENDYLEVIPTSADSLPTNSTKKYCGEYLADQPLIINSESNVLKLRFKSDNLFRYRGFKCRYRAMHPNGVAVINTYLSGEETNGEIMF